MAGTASVGAGREPSLENVVAERLGGGALLGRRAEFAFGDLRKADTWLRRPSRALDGAKPLDLAATQAGGRLVEQVFAGTAWGAAA